jgi:hypothetical protein
MGNYERIEGIGNTSSEQPRGNALSEADAKAGKSDTERES